MNAIKIYMFFFTIFSFSQNQTIKINSYTTKLVFNDPIEIMDESSSNVIVDTRLLDQKYVLMLKSLVSKDEFISCNVFLKTKSGLYYDFVIKYDLENKPNTYFINNNTALNYKDNVSIKDSKDLLISKETPKKTIQKTLKKDSLSFKENSLNNDIKKVLNSKPMFRKAVWDSNGLILKVLGVYVKDYKVFYKINITNNSGLSYKIKYFKFIVVTKPKKNRTSELVKEFIPNTVVTYPKNKKEILAKDSQDYVFVLDQISIENKEEFNLEIKELNGSRDFKAYVPSKFVNNPKILN